MSSPALIVIPTQCQMPLAGSYIKSEAYYQARRLVMMSQNVLISSLIILYSTVSLLSYCLTTLLKYNEL